MRNSRYNSNPYNAPSRISSIGILSPPPLPDPIPLFPQVGFSLGPQLFLMFVKNKATTANVALITVALPEGSVIDQSMANFYTASIDWGDGTAKDKGQFISTDGGFFVSGTHTYTGDIIKTFNVTVTVSYPNQAVQQVISPIQYVVEDPVDHGFTPHPIYGGSGFTGVTQGNGTAVWQPQTHF